MNGRAAITGSDTVAVCDLETGQQLGRELPYRPIRIIYSADGSQLAVAGDDRVNFTTEEWERLGPHSRAPHHMPAVPLNV